MDKLNKLRLLAGIGVKSTPPQAKLLNEYNLPDLPVKRNKKLECAVNAVTSINKALDELMSLSAHDKANRQVVQSVIDRLSRLIYGGGRSFGINQLIQKYKAEDFKVAPIGESLDNPQLDTDDFEDDRQLLDDPEFDREDPDEYAERSADLDAMAYGDELSDTDSATSQEVSDKIDQYAAQASGQDELENNDNPVVDAPTGDIRTIDTGVQPGREQPGASDPLVLDPDSFADQDDQDEFDGGVAADADIDELEDSEDIEDDQYFEGESRMCFCSVHCPESGHHDKQCCEQTKCACFCHDPNKKQPVQEKVMFYYNADGGQTNNAFDGSSNKNNIYKPIKAKDESPNQLDHMEPSPNDLEVKVNVPANIKKQLRDHASQAREDAKTLGATDRDAHWFYQMLANAFDELADHLDRGTLHDIKKAQILLTSLMSPIRSKIPAEVNLFISKGGAPLQLKDYFKPVEK